MDEEKKVETHVSDKKKEIVKELEELMNKKTVMVVSIKNLPAAQFQEIKKELRGQARIIVAKKNLINLALEECKAKGLEKLEEVVKEDFALLFSDENAFEISAMLAKNQTPAKAKVGQIAQEDISIEAGPTSLVPGPDISALGAVGLKIKVENGKLTIENSKIIVKKGEEINAAQSGILAKLDITPFKIGLEPLAAFFEGEAYFDIKIDFEEILKNLDEMYSKGLAFAVSLNYVNDSTLPFILSKAASHETALSGLIKEEKAEEPKAEEKILEEKSSSKKESENEKDGSEKEKEEKSDSNEKPREEQTEETKK
jgi:large subunit ribosomal protein L10